jgi:hypothetical protein
MDGTAKLGKSTDLLAYFKRYIVSLYGQAIATWGERPAFVKIL